MFAQDQIEGRGKNQQQDNPYDDAGEFMLSRLGRG